MTNYTTHRIRGDWMSDGYIDNLGGGRLLVIAVVDGRAHDVDDAGHVLDVLTLHSDGEIRGWGAGVGFGPDAGELDRIGRNLFRAA